jgi:hypothetical protein
MRPTERTEAPHIPEQLLLLEYALGILREGDEELVFLGRELHRFAADGDHSRGGVDLEVAHGQARVPRAVRGPQYRAHARDELVLDEWLAVGRFVGRLVRADRGRPRGGARIGADGLGPREPNAVTRHLHLAGFPEVLTRESRGFPGPMSDTYAPRGGSCL